MELTAKEKGNLTELQCMTEFYKAGYKVSIPYGENSRYDMILDVNGHLLRVQCKTSRTVSEECFSFSCRSVRVNSHGSHVTKYTKNEIDYFSTFYNGKCYLIPVEECGVEKKLRFCYPSSGQKVGISLAEKYEFDKVLKQFE